MGGWVAGSNENKANLTPPEAGAILGSKDWIFCRKLLFLLGRSDPVGGNRLAG